MMKKGKKSLAAIFACILLALLAAAGAQIFAFANVEYKENFIGYSANIADEQLFNGTNTFAYSDGGHNVSSEGKNNLAIKGGAPQITVLTHGLAGRAGQFSNDGTYDEHQMMYFAYDQNSLIERLAKKAGGANIYWAFMIEDLSNDKSFKLIDVNVQSKTGRYENNKVKTLENIEDISKHIIIVWDGNCTEGDAAQHYRRFNYMLDKVVYDVKTLNGGALPKVNLVGYSYGGIINMQYALDHPELVESMASIDSTFMGSDTAAFGYTFFPAATLLINDLKNPTLYNGYRDRWNNGYDEFYSKIDMHAIGGYSTVDYFIAMARTDTSELNWALRNLPDIMTFAMLLINGNGVINFNNLPLLAVMLEDILPKEHAVQMLASLVASMDYDSWWEFIIRRPILQHDVLSPLYSQLGQMQFSSGAEEGDYKGFNRYVKKYTPYNTNFNKRANSQMPAVVHSVAALDNDVINYILGKLTVSEQTSSYYFDTIDNGSGTCAITGYIGSTDETTLSVPSQVGGKTVTRIDGSAFSNNFNGNNIKTVILPSTVTAIGRSAFENCDKLESVRFSGTTLEEVGDGAFEGCVALGEISVLGAEANVLPGSIEQIGERAFFGTAIGSLVLPAGVQEVGAGAFSGGGLSQITVDGQGENYYSDGGVLYSAQGALHTYPAKKTDTSFVVPAGITKISAAAFYANGYLQRLGLGDVTKIEPQGIYGCSQLGAITGDKVASIESDSILYVPWLDTRAGDRLALGKVLIKYYGTESELWLDGYTCIGARALEGNQSVQKVYVGEQTEEIGENAFYDCSNLEELYLLHGNYYVTAYWPTFTGHAENRVIYVPGKRYGDYVSSGRYSGVRQDIRIYKTLVSFDTLGGIDPPDAYFEYQGERTWPQVAERAGYRMSGWYFEQNGGVACGQKMEYGDYWKGLTPTATLYAGWEEIEYSAVFLTDGGTLAGSERVLTYTVGSGLQLPVPTKDKYDFVGWYLHADFSGQAQTEIPKGEIGNKTFYAKWTGTKYTVSFNLDYPQGEQISDIKLAFDEDHYILPVPRSRRGYFFNGWIRDGVLYADEQGQAMCPWNIPYDCELKAYWQPEEYYVEIDTGEGSKWLANDGIYDKIVPISYAPGICPCCLVENNSDISAALFKSGYDFNGINASCWVGSGWLPRHQATVVYRTNYVARQFQISLFPHDGIVYSPIVKEFCGAISLPQPQKKGYTFEGWHVMDCYANDIFDNTVFSKHSKFDYRAMPDLSVCGKSGVIIIYLYAKFEAKEYPVHFESPNAALVMPQSMIVVYDQKTDLPVVEAKGYDFDGWYWKVGESKSYITDKLGKMKLNWSIDEEEITLYCDPKKVEYAITYILNGLQEDPSNKLPRTYKSPEVNTEYKEIYLPKSFASINMRFIGWYDNAAFTGEVYDKISYGMTEHKTFYAKTIDLYSTTLYFNDGTPNTVLYYDIGDTVSLPYRERGGYRGGWLIYGATIRYELSMGAPNVTISKPNFDAYIMWEELHITECYTPSTNTYSIYTEGQLRQMKTLSYNTYLIGYGTVLALTCNFELHNDLTLTALWTPEKAVFTGRFNGNGHTINDMKIYITMGGYYGFFIEIFRGTVENLRFSNVQIGTNSGGGHLVVAGSVCAFNKQGTIKNVTVASGMLFHFGTAQSMAGGIAGKNEAGTITKCYNLNFTISGAGSTGKIAGSNTGIIN